MPCVGHTQSAPGAAKLWGVQFLDLSFGDGASNLACDEWLLNQAESGARGAVLRFWEAPEYFVALGYTNCAATEANLAACAAAGAAVLRRVSGGGTVLQGPGCLNYALVHPIEPGEILNVEATNRRVMETQRAAIESALGERVAVEGHTDLAVNGRKFSGNAQRRRSRYFLFHGTILLDFDLELVERLLRPPSKEPGYRARRAHGEFLRNLPLSRPAVKAGLRRAWGAGDEGQAVSDAELLPLLETKYRRAEWNLRF